MKRILIILPLLLVCAAVAPAAEWEVHHPDSVLVGAWTVPVFAHVDSAARDLRAVLATRSDTLAFAFVSLPAAPGRASFGLYVEEPLLFLQEKGNVSIRVYAGSSDEPVYEGDMPVTDHLANSWILSIDDGGRTVLWQGDGAGGLIAIDTLPEDVLLEDALLIENGLGQVDVAAVTTSGEIVLWTLRGELEEKFRIAMGGHGACIAPLPGRDDFLVGFVDGRICLVDTHSEDVKTVASVRGIPTSLAVGDGAGDIEEDLIATVLEMSRSTLVCFRGQPDGYWEDPDPTESALPSMGRQVIFADLDAGGKEELLLLLDGGRALLSAVMLWGIEGTYAVPENLDLAGVGDRPLHHLFKGDWNADGRVDVGVVHGSGESVLELFVQNAGDARSFSPVDILPVGGAEVGIVVADLDRNGASDIIVAEGNFGVWLNDGRGRLYRHPSPPRGRPARLFAIAGQ
ncbi:MAG: VCBS repeat-containing protein [Gemmatimonadetes bacterium]|nr:VCBS repeat-containing protein [Gemmatimonadota bacterium]